MKVFLWISDFSESKKSDDENSVDILNLSTNVAEVRSSSRDEFSNSFYTFLLKM